MLYDDQLQYKYFIYLLAIFRFLSAPKYRFPYHIYFWESYQQSNMLHIVEYNTSG